MIAQVQTAHLRDVLVYGEAQWLNMWAALVVAVAAITAAGVFLTRATGVALGVSALALAAIGNAPTAWKDIAAAFQSPL